MQDGKSVFAFSEIRPESSQQDKEDLHRFLAEYTSEIVTLYDPAGQRVYASPAFERTFGSPDRPTFEGLHPEDLQKAELALERVQDGAAQTLAYRHRDLDGKWRSLEAKLKPVMFRGRRHVLAVSRDLTNQNSLEEQLRHAQKMEALGRLAGGVAHDFNNLLTAINGYAELALQDIPPGSSAGESIAEIKLAAERAAGVTRQLLTFSRRDPRRPREVEVGTVAAGLERMLRLLLGEDVALRIQRAPEKLTVQCDPAQLEQVIVNLVSNARDASTPGNVVRLECDLKRVNDRDRNVPAYVQPGEYVRIRVSDSGTGMPAEVAAQAFEPFFTTKPAGVGTGLGLSTVFGIIKQAEGFVWIDSTPRKGTTIHVLLPLAETGAVQGAQAAGAGRAISLAGLRIALVEDDDLVRKFAEIALGRHGAKVHAFSSGGETLRQLLDEGAEIDALVTDVVLPGMTGVSLAAAARHLWPEVAILFMSGYAADLTSDREIALARPLLEKPFTAAELVQTIAELVSAARAGRA